MHDNTTSQPAANYDKNITKTIPFYSNMLKTILEIVSFVQPDPCNWLDVGCGTGNLVFEAAKRFRRTHFTLADPSEAMLKLAMGKSSSFKSRINFVQAGTEEIVLPAGEYEVVTALLSHHYFDFETRKKATMNCFNLLTKGGIYINIETIMPLNNEGLTLSLKSWQNAQVQAGKTLGEAKHHLSRFGSKLKPINIFEHLDLLKKCEYSYADLFWFTNMQAGFYAVK